MVEEKAKKFLQMLPSLLSTNSQQNLLNEVFISEAFKKIFAHLKMVVHS